MVPNELLEEFFKKLNNPCYGMDWRRLGRRQVEPLLALMEYFPPGQRESAEAILRNVFDLACESGAKVIRDLARSSGPSDLLARLPDHGSLYHQAMWVWLQAPGLFEQAVLFHQVDQLSWWSKRNDLPSLEPPADRDTLGLLAGDVSRLLTKEQGRGKQCTVEHVYRDSGTDYFFCFPDDYVRTVTLHDRRGRLTTRTLRQTFEIIFAYRRDAGTLETYAQVPPRLKRELDESFAWLILDTSLGPTLPKRVYDLNRLKACRFQLNTDPRDHVHARIRTLQLSLPDHYRRITLESRVGAADDVFRMVEECLNEEHVTLDEADVSRAAIQFQFDRTGGRKPGTMTVEVAHPDRCSLRSHRPERVSVVEKHFRMWRITGD
jgi:hypothetical protein